MGARQSSGRALHPPRGRARHVVQVRTAADECGPLRGDPARRHPAGQSRRPHVRHIQLPGRRQGDRGERPRLVSRLNSRSGCLCPRARWHQDSWRRCPL
jgi:hypothetical protein